MRRRLLVPALISGAILAVAPGAALAAHRPDAHAAQQGPDQTLDASDPTQSDKVGDALDLCTTLDNCSWVTDSVGFDYGPAQIIGDALYNCSSDEYAATAVGVKAERAESTNVSESVSAKISLSFIGFAKSSAEFKATSSQRSTFDTSVQSTNDVEVPPGWKGGTRPGSSPRS